MINPLNFLGRLASGSGSSGNQVETNKGPERPRPSELPPKERAARTAKRNSAQAARRKNRLRTSKK